MDGLASDGNSENGSIYYNFNIALWEIFKGMYLTMGEGTVDIQERLDAAAKKSNGAEVKEE